MPDNDTIEPFEAKPPTWRPALHESASLGWPDFLPDHRDRPENHMTESNIKKGMHLAPYASHETSSAHDDLFQRLQTPDAMTRLGNAMSDIFARREEMIGGVGPSTFKAPSRVTMIESRRMAWLADLANPDIPLHQLGPRVPHGPKGSDLFELLYSKDVPIDRAVWFVRVLGSNETAAMRSRANYNPVFYSLETTKEVTNYLRRQFAEITLPSAIRAAVGVKQSFKGVLLDADTRESWTSRYCYTIELVREFYIESMVERGTFLLWLSQQLAWANLAQLGVLIYLVDEYIDDLCTHRAFAKHLVDGCLLKLDEIESSPTATHLQDLKSTLWNYIHIVLLELPDAFINPPSWQLHAQPLLGILSAYRSLDPDVEDGVEAFTLKTLKEHYGDVNDRNRALLFGMSEPEPMPFPREDIEAIRRLNSLNETTDISTFSYFEEYGSASFKPRLDLLLTWAVCRTQYGDHRPYSATAILSKWRDETQLVAIRRRFTQKPDRVLHAQLFRWLHASPICRDANNIAAVAALFGELVRRNVFSYARYIQELIARGEMDQSLMNPSHHVHFLQTIPLLTLSAPLEHQRRALLFGIEADETVEDRSVLAMKRELQVLLPELLTNENPISRPDLSETAPMLLSASRYEQARAIHHWLLPVIKNVVSKPNQGSVDSPVMTVDTYATLTQLLFVTKLYPSILEVNLLLLTFVTTRDLLSCILDTLRRHRLVWACMGVVGQVIQVLLAKLDSLRALGIQLRSLLTLIIDLDDSRYLTEIARDTVVRENELIEAALVTATLDFAPLPSAIPEIHQLVMDTFAGSPADLAKALWSRHKFASDWPVIVWESVLEGLQQFASSGSSRSELTGCVSRLAELLTEVDHHLITGLDLHVRTWCEGPGGKVLLQLDPSQWEMLGALLLKLAVTHTVACSTILESIAYPAWKTVCSVNHYTEGSLRQAHAACIQQTLLLIECLLLLNEVPQDVSAIVTINLEHVHRLQTARISVYSRDHFATFLRNLPYILALETKPTLDSAVAVTVSRTIRGLFHDAVFKQHAFRDPSSVKRAFLEAKDLFQTTVMEDRIYQALANLMMIDDDSVKVVSEISESLVDFWPRLVSQLNPWRCHRIAVSLQLTLRTLCRTSQKEGERSASSHKLEQLTKGLFQHSWSGEDLGFISELLRDVDVQATGKLLVRGLEHSTEVLRVAVMDSTGAISQKSIQLADDVLCLMFAITSPERVKAAEPADRPSGEETAQDSFLEVLCDVWRPIESKLFETIEPEAYETRSYDTDLVHELVVVSVRLLHYVVGVLDIWSPKCKQLAEEAILVLIQLAHIYGSEGPLLDGVVFSMLLDTACYLINELPPNPRNPHVDIWRVIPGVAPNNISPHMCEAHRKRLRQILQYVPKDYYVDGLQWAPSEKCPGALVQNRPWEWVENIDPRPTSGEVEIEDYAAFPPPNRPVLNTASISLELFQAKGTRDRVASPSVAEGASSAEEIRRKMEERATGDGLGGEMSSERDWRQGRVPLRGARLVLENVSDDDTDGDEEWPNVEDILGEDGAMHEVATTSSDSREPISQSGKRMAMEVIDIESSDDGSEVVEVRPPRANRARGRGKGRATGRARAAARRNSSSRNAK